MLNSLCGGYLVQGGASASLELRICSGRQLVSCLWPGMRVGGQGLLSQTSRRALTGQGLWRGGHLPLVHAVSLPLLRGRDLWLKDLGQVRSMSVPGQTVALDFPMYQEVEMQIHTPSHPFTVAHSTKLSIVLDIHYLYCHTHMQVHTSQTHTSSGLHSVSATALKGRAAGVLWGQGQSGRGRLLPGA